MTDYCLKQVLGHDHCRESDDSDTSISRNAGEKSGNVHSGFTDILQERQEEDLRCTVGPGRRAVTGPADFPR